MNKKHIDKIIKEYKEVFDILEEYDKTHELPEKVKKKVREAGIEED